MFKIFNSQGKSIYTGKAEFKVQITAENDEHIEGVVTTDDAELQSVFQQERYTLGLSVQGIIDVDQTSPVEYFYDKKTKEMFFIITAKPYIYKTKFEKQSAIDLHTEYLSKDEKQEFIDELEYGQDMAQHEILSDEVTDSVWLSLVVE